MKFPTAALCLALLTTGCGHRARQIIGTWGPPYSDYLSVTLSPDGGFSTQFINTNQTVVLTYQGTWQLNGDDMICTITNASGTKKHEPAGSIDRMKIVRLDSGHLYLAQGSMTNYLVKK
jgi:hypothetical protein